MIFLCGRHVEPALGKQRRVEDDTTALMPSNLTKVLMGVLIGVLSSAYSLR